MLKALDAELRRAAFAPAYESAAFVDRGPLLERGLAMKAGLGWRGKNGGVINGFLVGRFNVGLLLTNAGIEPDEPISPEFSLCGRCRVCIDACPGGAISDAGFDYRRCVSFLTQSKSLSPKDERLLGNRLYGCDVCQDVCPRNAGKYAEPLDNIDAARPKLADMANISNAQFRERWGASAIAWRGAAVLRRNAAAALRNIQNPGGPTTNA
jgi:epoxyqueuosine reductase